MPLASIVIKQVGEGQCADVVDGGALEGRRTVHQYDAMMLIARQRVMCRWGRRRLVMGEGSALIG